MRPLIASSAEKTKNGTDEISDYGRDRRLHGTPATEKQHAVRVLAHRPDE